MKVELVTHTPYADLLVVNAARASFGKASSLIDIDTSKLKVKTELAISDLDEKEREKRECYLKWLYEYEALEWSRGNVNPSILKYEDFSLIHFLAREKHVLPFRHPHITLRCSAPIFVVRQLMKHQVGMSWSEESRRYIDSEPDFYRPDKWRGRADNVKQGSSDEELTEMLRPASDDWLPVNEVVEDYLKYASAMYQDALSSGMAPEQARMFLPQSMMTTWVWTGSLLSWHHMLTLRLDEHTQKETRDFAQMVKDIITPLAPASMEALLKHGSSTSN